MRRKITGFARQGPTIEEAKAADRHGGTTPAVDLPDEHIPDNVHKPTGRV